MSFIGIDVAKAQLEVATLDEVTRFATAGQEGVL